MPIFQCLQCPRKFEVRWVEMGDTHPCPGCNGPTRLIYKPTMHPTVMPYNGIPIPGYPSNANQA